MIIELMKDKVSEWESQKEICMSKTMCDLLQKSVLSSKNNISNYEKIILELNRNEENANNALSILNEIKEDVTSGKMESYYDMTIYKSEKLTQQQKDELKEKFSPKQHFVENNEMNNELNGIADEVLNELIETNRILNKFTLERTELSLELRIRSLTFLLSTEKYLFKQYKECLQNAFNFHDYGQWENFKNELKNFVISLNKYTGAVSQIAQFVNILDESKNQVNFYSLTDKNVSNIEQQLEALHFAENFGESIIKQLSFNKYDLPTIDETGYEYLMRFLH